MRWWIWLIIAIVIVLIIAGAVKQLAKRRAIDPVDAARIGTEHPPAADTPHPAAPGQPEPAMDDPRLTAPARSGEDQHVPTHSDADQPSAQPAPDKDASAAATRSEFGSPDSSTVTPGTTPAEALGSAREEKPPDRHETEQLFSHVTDEPKDSSAKVTGGADGRRSNAADSPALGLESIDDSGTAAAGSGIATAGGAGYATTAEPYQGTRIPSAVESSDPAVAQQPSAEHGDAQPIGRADTATPRAGKVIPDETLEDSEPARDEAAPAVSSTYDTTSDPITAQLGEGAASPREDGSPPSDEYTIKGNAETMLFYPPVSPRFQTTEAEVWFKDEASARRAGFLDGDRRA